VALPGPAGRHLDLVPELDLTAEERLVTATVLFLATYAVVALGRVPMLRLDRTGAAVVGAAFMVALGVVSPEQAYTFVDMGTLVLLFGMMVIVGHLKLAGFFRWTAARVARHARTPRMLLAGIVAVSGALSALFVNDTVCLALTPLVLEVTTALGVRSTPYLLALATASNIGSAATLTGNPQNMLIGVASGIPYAAFFRSLLPVAALGLVVDFVVVAAVYRGDLRTAFPAPPHPRVKVHGFLMAKGLAATVTMLAFFFAGAPLPIVALTAGAALLLTRRVKPEKVFLEVNWNLLTLFAGLFVVVGAAREAGLTGRLFDLLHARDAHSPAGLTALSAVLSNLVSNVPAVMLFIPLVPHFPDPPRAWRVLAMSSTFAGNLTLVGSIANLIVAEGARRVSPVSFREYLKVGVPVTLATLVMGALLL
jgi:Na+/H+ antiporter NhaD/arsenite permease-like protein